jgi:UDP-N-acetyl-D-mannosaminuronic acid dehydrogenase
MKRIVVLGGCGHAGLPFALALANSGFDSTSLDISIEAVEMINSGKMPFMEDGALEILTKTLQSNNFRATTDFNAIKSADILVIMIGTPIDENNNSNPAMILDLISECMPHMNSTQLVILRSTVLPGTTDLVAKLLQKNGISADVVFCPERILQGHAIKELYELPQIIGSENVIAQSRASDVFTLLGVKTIVVSTREAEMAKLFTNVWRYIKFAIANQFWLLSNDAGLDYSKIRDAIAFDYPRASDLPGAGFTAGPCLHKDTHFLATASNNNFDLGYSAILINEGMPDYVVSKIEERFDLSNKVVGILGMSFKADSDDIRSSLSYRLKEILEKKSVKVLTSDPFVTTDTKLLPESQVLMESDILIIGSPHSRYKNILTEKPLIDFWNILGKGSQI